MKLEAEFEMGGVKGGFSFPAQPFLPKVPISVCFPIFWAPSPTTTSLISWPPFFPVWLVVDQTKKIIKFPPLLMCFTCLCNSDTKLSFRMLHVVTFCFVTGGLTHHLSLGCFLSE